MKNLLFISLLFIVNSCNNTLKKEPSKSYNESTANQESKFISDTTILGRNFRSRFTEKEDLEIVRLIGLCKGEPSDSIDIMKPPCDNRLFKIVQLNDNIPKDNLCLIEVEKRIFGNRDRKIYVVEKQNNQFIRLNTMIGYLEETRTTKNGYKDLLIVHLDHKEKMTFAMKYSWDKKIKKYIPKLLESYDGIFSINLKKQDSVTKIAINNLIQKKLILD